jgi:hypothetical protein
MIRTKTEREAKHKALSLSLLLMVFMATMLLTAKPAHAATFTVDRNDDPDPTTATACTAAPNDCSLRGAIVAANAATGADAITVPAGTYTLTRAGADEDVASTGDLDVTGELTITGAGTRTTSVAGGAAPFDDRIFDIQPDVTATITGLTITGGKPANSQGGGVQNNGDLTLDRVAVKGNTAQTHGGITSHGTLNLTDSTVSGNSAEIVGGVFEGSGTANITNSTISGNQATNINGGIAASSSALINILNSTIASNTSPRLGGGIITSVGSLVIVRNTIISGNTVNNCDTAQLGGVISSQGNNISSDDSCPFTKPTDKQNTNPLLGPLQDNGGPTDTRALLPGSPAVDAANSTTCSPTDQRGIARKDGDKNGSVICDIGAFERNDPIPPRVTTTAPTNGQTGVRRNATLTATFSERMNRATLNKSTFKLFRVASNGSTTQITNVVVDSSTDGLKATLNPFGTSSTVLAANTRYKAVVTTAAKDRAGNRLDQNSTQPNNQQKEWFFTVKN